MKRTLFIMFFAAILPCLIKANAATPGVIHLNDGEALPSTEKNQALVIDFNATWCGPCRTFAPVFEQVAKEMAGKALFVSVDVDNNPDLARSFSVRYIPCVVVMQKGKEPVTHMGIMTREKFTDFLRAALK